MAGWRFQGWLAVSSVAVSESVRTTECPSERLAPLWAAVIVDEQIKTKLINHTLLALQLRGAFAFETTAVHGLIALVGPPGTGKTTLARGLAHQLSGVLSGERTRLIEVTPHGLMSAEQRRAIDHRSGSTPLFTCRFQRGSIGPRAGSTPRRRKRWSPGYTCAGATPVSSAASAELIQ